MNTNFTYIPEVHSADGAALYHLLDTQTLSLRREGVPGAYSGGLQAVVASRPGEDGTVLPDGEVHQSALHEWLRDGYDLLFLRGEVDLVTGLLNVTQAAMVICDDLRWMTALDLLRAGDLRVCARFKRLTIQAVLRR